jgi:hypothetical protein
MYVVIGVWQMDPGRASTQAEGLERIVAGVGQLPGLVKGYWTRDYSSSRSHTFVIFDERAVAEAFAADVRGNFENQARAGVANVSLSIDEIVAQT